MKQPVFFGNSASHTGGGIALLQSGCIEAADRPRMPRGRAQRGWRNRSWAAQLCPKR